MKGFIIYPTYRIIEDKAYIYLYGRLENNQSFLTIHEFKPYFFIKDKDLKKAKKLENFEHKKTELTNFKKEPVTKIILSIPAEVPKLRKILEKEGIETYEADIRFAYRFMIDKKIQGSIEIEGEYEMHQTVDRVYKKPEISPAEYHPKNLKVLSLDIETSTDGTKLYCLSLYSEKYKKSFIVSQKKFKNTISCPDEETLLENFQKSLLLEDPDIITGWHVIDFDLEYLKKKFKKYKIPFALGRDNTNSKIKIQANFFRDSKADISGRQVLDGLILLRSSFIKLKDYKLETAAIKFLGKKKLIKQEDKSKIDEYYKKNQKLLLDYNMLDSELVYDIIYKSNVLDLTIQRSLLAGMALNRVSASIASFDSVYLKKARERKLVAPSAHFSEKPSPIKGGFVMESKPGIYDHVLLLDFKSLYPSVIRTFNISPLSFLGKKKEKNTIKSPNNVYFSNEPGILPEILTTLFKERENARKQKNELSRQAIKILMLSFWGIIASPSFRFFNMDMANAITNFSQYIIKFTAKKIEELGYEVIYADTDSNFVNVNVKTEKEAGKIGKQIEYYINNFYKDFIKKEYKRESFLELEFEKDYIRFLMPKIRSGEAGAKKRYSGLLKKDGKEEIEIVGLEFVRCFVPENVVPATEGIKKINQLSINDKLFGLNLETQKPELVSPKNCFKYNYNGKIIKIAAEGGHKFKVTPEHNFFVLVPSATRSRWTRGFCRYKTGYIITKQASELKRGEYLISLNKLPRINKTNFADQESLLLARFFGYFLGEGRLYERYSNKGLHQRRLMFTFGDNEHELIEDCRLVCKKLFKKGLLTYKEKSSKKAISLYTDLNKELFNLIKDDIVLNKHSEKYIRTLALTHKVPKFILNGNKKIITTFLQAYFDSEGTVGRELGVTTISKQLSNGVCYLLRKLGIQYSYSTMPPNPRHKLVHRKHTIIIGLSGFKQFSKEVGFKSKYKQDRLLSELKSRNLKRARYIRPLNDNLILRKVKDIGKENYVGEIYDIEIDSEHKNYFIDYILTHNSDWTEAAQIFQKELLDKIFHKQEISSFVKKFIKEIYDGEYDKKLVYRKQLRKDAEAYVKTTPPHVKAVRKLDGKFEGKLVEYYITTNGPEPIQKLKHKIDYDHYIDKQIKPIAEMILTFFNLQFDDLIKGTKQTKLFNY